MTHAATLWKCICAARASREAAPGQRASRPSKLGREEFTMLFLGALGAGCFNSKQCQAQLNTARQHGPVLLCRHSKQDLASAQQTTKLGRDRRRRASQQQCPHEGRKTGLQRRASRPDFRRTQPLPSKLLSWADRRRRASQRQCPHEDRKRIAAACFQGRIFNSELRVTVTVGGLVGPGSRMGTVARQ